jgi:hypothetical protein
MSKMSYKSWWGWVPLLTRDAFLSSLEERKEKAKIITDRCKKEYGLDLDFKLFHKDGLDIWDICLREEMKKWVSRGKCEVDKQGMCKIVIEELKGTKECDVAATIYRIIKNVYHEHIHHRGDQPLSLLEVERKGDAIKGVLDQYRKKIVFYHEAVTDSVRKGKVYDAFDLAMTGQGEMRYALAYVSLFYEGDEKETLTEMFNNAVASLNVLLSRTHAPVIFRKILSINWLGFIGGLLTTFFGGFVLLNKFYSAVDSILYAFDIALVFAVILIFAIIVVPSVKRIVKREMGGQKL